MLILPLVMMPSFEWASDAVAAFPDMRDFQSEVQQGVLLAVHRLLAEVLLHISPSLLMTSDGRANVGSARFFSAAVPSVPAVSPVKIVESTISTVVGTTAPLTTAHGHADLASNSIPPPSNSSPLSTYIPASALITSPVLSVHQSIKSPISSPPTAKLSSPGDVVPQPAALDPSASLRSSMAAGASAPALSFAEFARLNALNSSSSAATATATSTSVDSIRESLSNGEEL